jgi:coenzyme PQQ biosynthesis protein PqqD
MALDDLHQQFPLGARPAQNEGFSVDKIPCCWIITKDEGGKRIKLNDSSMLIWQLCEADNTVGDIIGALQEQFPDVEAMDKDIQRALDELLEEELISMQAA